MFKRMIAWAAVLTLALSMVPQMMLGVTAEGAVPADHSHSAAQHACAHCTDAVTWEAWGDTETEQKTLPTASGHYYLVSDVKKTAKTEVAKDADIVLCLNGYTIDGNRTDTIYRMGGTAQVRIDDCTAYTDAEDVYHAGQIINGLCTTNVAGTFYVYGSAKLTVTDGIIRNSRNERTLTDDGYGGGALHVRETANVTLENVVFENCYAKKDGGVLVMRNSGASLTATGCTFKGNTTDGVGSVMYIYNGSAEFKDCVFTGNTSKSNNGGVGRIVTGTASFEGCTFTENTATIGSAFYLRSTGDNVISFRDCVFEKNTTTGGASGVLYLYDAKAVLDNCVIRDNTAKGNGGSAIYMTYGANVTLKDTTITGNKFTGTDTGARAAIYLTKTEDQLTLQGKTVLENNLVASDSETPFNRSIFLQTVLTTPIDVGGLTDGAKLEIFSSKAVSAASEIVGAATAPTAWNRTWVVCENNGMAVEYTTEKGFHFATNTDHIHCECGNAACTETGATHEKIEFVAWTGENTLPDSGAFYLTGPVTVSATTNVTGKLYLCLNGQTVTATADRFFTLKGSGELTITDCCQTPGKLTGSKNSAILTEYASSSKTVLNLYNGVLTGNTGNPGGGAVRLQGGGTFNMYGGSITGNSVKAVASVNSDGTPALDSNKVQKVTYGTGGAGIYVAGSNATFNMYGGKISDNVTTSCQRQKADGKQETVGGNGGGIYSEGTINLISGTISGNSARDGGGIYSKGILNLKGTTVSDNTASKNGAGIYTIGGKVYLTSGTVSGNKSDKDGGGVYNREGTTQISGDVMITGNSTKTAGGGISFSGNQQVTVSGGTVENNTAGSSGGMIIQGGSVVTISGGTFRNNTTTGYAGAIRLYASTLTVTGGTFTGNSAKNGGAISAENSSTLNIQGGQFTDNTATGMGGGIYAAANTTMSLSGAPVIKANGTSNLYLSDGMLIQVADMAENASVGVTGNVGAFTQACQDYSNQFSADSKYLKVEYVDGALHLVSGGEHKHCLCGDTGIGCDHTNVPWVAWESKTSLPTSGSYYLLEDVVLTDEVSITGNLNLCLNGHTVTAAKENRIFSTPSNKDITINISDCTAATVDSVYTAGKLTGGTENGDKVGGGAIYLRAGAKLNLYDGMISGNQGYAGGALILTTNTEFTMYGGAFSDNTAIKDGAASNGGAIYAMKGACVDIRGGSFKNNTGASGGAIYFDGTGKLTVSGGSFLNNTAATNGGAIYGKTGDVFLTGGHFEGNYGNKDGGAIYYREGNITVSGDIKIVGNESKTVGGGISFSGKAVVTISGGTVEGNKATGGGGIIVQGAANVTVTGGLIQNNQATGNYGGGAYVYGAALTVSGGTFTGNTAKTRGGAIGADNNAMLYVNGGTIDGNHSDVNGGGIYAKVTDLQVTGGKIINNTSTKDGAGLYYREGQVKIGSDALISGNVTKSAGGGISFSGEAIAVIDGGIIESNKANVGGGMIVQGKANLTVLGGTIQKNFAKNGAGMYVYQSSAEIKGGKITGNKTENGSGGGVYVTTDATFKMSGGSITNNYVTGAAGGVYLLRSTGTFSGGSISGNYAKGAGGGGIYVNGSTAYLYGISITNNEAKSNGGGVYSARNTVKKNGVSTDYSPKIYVAGAYIANNTAKTGGGLVCSGHGASFTMTSGTITGNNATGSCGGLYVSSKVSVKMTGGTISNNTAQKSGGGFYSNKAYGTVENTKFLNNTSETGAGGAMYLYRGSLIDFKNILVDGNNAYNVGGGVYADSHADYYTECAFENCVFTNNTAGTRGGAFYGSFGVEFDAIGCTFADNTAVGRDTESTTGNGGAIAVRDIARLKDCIFTGNKAQKGGAFYGGNMQLTYSVNGWGTKADAVEVVMDNCTFEGNKATETGGAIHNAMSSFATLDSVTFTGNSAGTQGSAIYAEDDLKMTDVTITGNVAANNGYALYYADSEYDGHTYIRGLFKLGGDIIVKDNEGGNVYFDNLVTVTMTGEGLGAKTHMEIALDKGVLTNRLYGAYNYEGGNLVYTVTYGTRSLTEPEVDDTLVVAEEATEQTDAAKDQAKSGDTWLYVGVGAVALVILAAVVLLFMKKKKAPTEANEE